jgi:hypothetical protein
MPFVYKTLGQVAPTDTNNANAYTVPTSTEAIVSSIVVCNTTATDSSFRIFQRIDGATAGASNAVAYDVPIVANSTTSLELKLTINAGDIITVRSANADALTFTLNGSEIA